MNGRHGRIVQQHVVLESKQGQEHVHMMLKTLAGHSLSKKVAPLPQPIGGHGQVVRKHAIVVSRPEQEHVHTMLQMVIMNQKLTSKRAITRTHGTHGQHGVGMIHAPIVVPVHLNNNAPDNSSSKYLHVHKAVKRFNTNIKRRIVIIKAIGVPVSFNKNK